MKPLIRDFVLKLQKQAGALGLSVKWRDAQPATPSFSRTFELSEGSAGVQPLQDGAPSRDNQTMQTVEELLQDMQGNSITQSWDALAVYDRGRANRLLQQQFIERFTNGHFFEPINDADPGETGVTYIYNNLKTGEPMLSFETANFSAAQARLTMDFISGAIIKYVHTSGLIPRVDEIIKIMPVDAPQLYMDITLNNASGAVGEAGNVEIDIGEGTNFKVNFTDLPVEQVKFGELFKNRFQALPPEQKKFSLGTLATAANGALTPTDFILRTTAAPGAKVRGAENFGDGAVVMFITLAGGQAGTPTPKDMAWLLPGDYTGALVISSRVFFDNLLKPDFLARLPVGSTLWDYEKGDGNPPFYGRPDKSWSLIGRTGSFNAQDKLYEAGFAGHLLFWKYTYHFDVASLGDSKLFEVCGVGNQLLVRWANENQTINYVAGDYAMGSEFPGVDYFKFSFEAKYQAQIDESGVVSFVQQPIASDVQPIKPAEDEVGKWAQDMSVGGAKDYAAPKAEALMKGFTTPEIDTFLVRNLLFPGNDVMRIKDAYLPGDLYLPGELDPSRVAFAIDPIRHVLQAGASFTFKTNPDQPGVEWTLHPVESRRVALDSLALGWIDTNGKYTAPDAGDIAEGVRHVVIRAQKDDKVSFAMVAVMNHALSVTPIYRYVAPSEKITLKAKSIDGAQVSWELLTTEQASSIAPNGETCEFKAGERNRDNGMIIDQVKVTSGSSTSIITLLIVNIELQGTLSHLPSSDPNNGFIDLQMCYEYEDEDGKWHDVCKSGEEVTWKLLVSGGATLDNGRLEAKGRLTGDFAIATATVNESGWKRGFMVIPLPLSRFPDPADGVMSQA